MKKYVLFGWYSAIGTLLDWILLKFLSLMVKGIALVTMLTTINLDMEYFNIFVRHGCAVSNIVSYAIGVAITFILSAKYAFKLDDNMGRRIRNTTIIHIMGLLVQSGLFAVLIHTGSSENTAKFITICENAVLMGAGNIFIVFRNYNKKDEKDETQKKVSGTWVSLSSICGYLFSYIEKSFFICLIQSSRNHVTLPM